MPRGDPTLTKESLAASPGIIASRGWEDGDAAADLAGLRLVGNDDYELGEEIARGGMGQIVAAHDKRHDRPVVIKRPLELEPGLVTRFVREARLTARLQHPAIVPIYEAGILPTGEPFFAMKHVAGSNLHLVVDGAKSFAERLALLPNLITIADALAYAHDHGVVHRDLTPSNILLGAHGETFIIDWGVAKEIGARGAADTTGGEVAVGPGATRVAGTPRYMAPEQARGEPADPRSDVYSLGAVLYFALSGAQPYPDVASATPSDVLARQTPALGSLVPEVPADLATIVARAMARSPEARYPNAAELAAELKRFATGELVRAHAYTPRALLRRWARRRRPMLVAAGVALAAIAVTVVLSLTRITRERDVAVTAQRRAERFSKSGEQLVASLLGTLTKELEKLGQLEALAGLGGEVARYYDAIGSADAADAATLEQRSWALMILGDVESDKGNIAQAAALYKSGLGLVEERVRRFRPDAAAHQRVARMKMRLGDVELSADRPEAARLLFVDGLRDAEAAAAADPDKPQYVRTVSLTRMRLGDLYQRSQELRAARVEYAALLDTVTRAHERWPDDDEVTSLFGWAQYRVAETDSWMGRYREAAEGLAATLITRRRLVERDPDNLPFKTGLAVAHIVAGDVAIGQGRAEDAIENYAAAVAALEGAVKADPENGSTANNIAMAYEGLCQAELFRARPADALIHCRAGATAIGPRVSDTESRDQATRAELMLGTALLRNGDLGAATASARTAAARFAQLRDANPGYPTHAASQARAQRLLAAIGRDVGRPLEALALAIPAALSAEAFLAPLPDSAVLRIEAVEGWLAVADLERELSVDARAAYQRALTLCAGARSGRLRGLMARAHAGLGDLAAARSIAAELEAEGSLPAQLAKELALAGVGP